MRISVERPPFPHSTPVCGASVCASPATSALCGPPLLMLLAWSTAGELAGSAEICARGDTEHAAHVGVLRLADPADYMTGTALLRHAVDTVPRLRRGGALLAGASDSSQLDALHSLGFGPSAAPAPEASDQGVESPSELVFLSRRGPGVPPAECSHTAVHVSSIVKWVDFFSLLGYEPSLIFSTSGARAAWVTAPWSQATIELIEVPKLLQQQRGGSVAGQLAGPVGGVGLVHVCLDLTPRCTSLCLLLEYLSAESQARFGKRLRILSPPRHQMMGNVVADVAVVRAPDGVPVELLRVARVLPQAMEPDWDLDEARREEEAAKEEAQGAPGGRRQGSRWRSMTRRGLVRRRAAAKNSAL